MVCWGLVEELWRCLKGCTVGAVEGSRAVGGAGAVGEARAVEGAKVVSDTCRVVVVVAVDGTDSLLVDMACLVCDAVCLPVLETRLGLTSALETRLGLIMD